MKKRGVTMIEMMMILKMRIPGQIKSTSKQNNKYRVSFSLISII